MNRDGFLFQARLPGGGLLARSYEFVVALLEALGFALLRRSARNKFRLLEIQFPRPRLELLGELLRSLSGFALALLNPRLGGGEFHFVRIQLTRPLFKTCLLGGYTVPRVRELGALYSQTLEFVLYRL